MYDTKFHNRNNLECVVDTSYEQDVHCDECVKYHHRIIPLKKSHKGRTKFPLTLIGLLSIF